MRHYWSLEEVHLHNTWLTIGSFDGVHRGHQEILRKLTAGAHKSGSPAVVITFFPHPSVVLGKREDAFYLTSPEERAALLGRYGADVVITYPFDRQVASTTARDFIARLDAHLDMRHLIVGYDFALGKGREGNVPRLKELGEEFGYTVDSIPPLKIGGEVVSSSRIRELLMDGKVEQAAQLLGRPHQIAGDVIAGDGRGSTIGIPTANLAIWAEKTIPKKGVYVCQAEVGGETWGAVTNIGVRPTFDSQSVTPTVETHLLDFNEDLYGLQIRLGFLSRLRDEQRFPNAEALVNQIHADIENARQDLAERNFSG